MGCGNNKKMTCGNGKQFAVCSMYEGVLPEWSTIVECPDLEETTKELYSKVTELIEAIDINDLSSECFEIDKVDGVITLKSFAQTILTKLEEILCPATPVELSGDIDITAYNLNMRCLVNSCGESITKLSEVLQALITKVCEEEDAPQVLINTGAIDLISKITHIQTTSASTSTLAVGREGQTKMIVQTIDGGNMVLGVPTLSGGTSITFDAVDDFVYLMFTAGKWRVITNNNCVIA